MPLKKFIHPINDGPLPIGELTVRYEAAHDGTVEIKYIHYKPEFSTGPKVDITYLVKSYAQDLYAQVCAMAENNYQNLYA